MPWKKVLALFRMMRAGRAGVNNLTRAADEYVREQANAYELATRIPDTSQADLVKASYLLAAREGFDILFARSPVRSEVALDNAEYALEALGEALKAKTFDVIMTNVSSMPVDPHGENVNFATAQKRADALNRAGIETKLVEHGVESNADPGILYAPGTK